MDTDKCYVFRRRDVRPVKRRRLECTGLEASLETRLACFEANWSRQQQRINDVIEETYATTLHDLDRFRDEVQGVRETSGKLPVAIFPTGHASSAGTVLFDRIFDKLTKYNGSLCVSIDALQGQNLKSFLSNLIRVATRATSASIRDDDEQIAPLSKGPRLLKYDLQALYDWCHTRSISEVTVAIPDGDSLNPALLNDLIMLFKSWQSRLRFTLLLGVSTPLEIFHDRLSYAATHVMEARSIEVMPIADMSSKIFDSLHLDPQASCRLGPNLSESLVRRQLEFPQPIESFVSSIKYTFMTHFYGNPLSVLLDSSAFKELDSAHCEAIRTLSSFRKHVEELISQGQVARARKLLESDTALLQDIGSELEASQSLVAWIMGACRLIRATIEDVKLPNPPSSLESYTYSLSGEFCRPGFRRELVLYLRKAPLEALSALSVKAYDILMTLPPSNVDMSPDEFSDVADSLTREAKLQESRSESKADTRVVGPRQARGKNSVSEATDALCDLLTRFFDRTLQPFTDMFLHEILFYDHRSPYTETFMPRISASIERALSAPKQYLGCQCCVDGEGSLRPTNPPTAILYQLYVESGALINVHDLLLAFKTILEKTVDDEQKLMALFYRGLAELKSLGLIKHSRRRVDHIAKLSWKGL